MSLARFYEENLFISNGVRYSAAKLRRVPTGFSNAIERTYDKTAELFFQVAIETGSVAIEDLDNKQFLAQVEDYMQQRYPNLDFSDDPAKIMLYKEGAPETRRVIRKLIREARLENITLQALNDLTFLATVEEDLSNLYPELDFSEDPAFEILEGTYKKEMEKVIDDLVP